MILKLKTETGFRFIDKVDDLEIRTEQAQLPVQDEKCLVTYAQKFPTKSGEYEIVYGQQYVIAGSYALNDNAKTVQKII